MIDDDLFTPDEFKILEYLQKCNITELEKIGVVAQNKIEENGLVKETLEFTSFDEKYHFVLTNTYFSANNKHELIKKINQGIDNAVEAEDYTTAAKLKHQKDDLLQA